MKSKITTLKTDIISLLLMIFLYSVSAQVLVLPEMIPSDINNDGTIVVGPEVGGSRLVLWEAANGIKYIEGPSMHIATISDDGAYLAATVRNPATNLYEMGLYDIQDETWTYLGSLSSVALAETASWAWDISADGMTVVGQSYLNSQPPEFFVGHAVKWTAQDGLQDLGVLDPPFNSTMAMAVSSNGSLICGYEYRNNTPYHHGSIWENDQQTLLNYANGDPVYRMCAVSGNGVWAGGGGLYYDEKACLWSEDTGVIEFSPPSNEAACVTSLSFDGSTAVGTYRQGPEAHAFIYSHTNGFFDLWNYAMDIGIDVNELVFGGINSARLSISADGSTIIGTTTNNEGFIMRLNGNQINNTVAGAIAVTCGETHFGNTQNATNNGGNNSPDVFYTYTGTGVAEYVTLSLCNEDTNYDSYLRVFGDENLTDMIASNDNACGQQSEVTFESDGTSTYYIMIEGAGTAAGNYSMDVGCEEILATVTTEADKLAFYPNPVFETLNVQASEHISRLVVQNISGQVIRELQPNAREFSVDFGALPSGMYFVTVDMNAELQTVKIVKQYQ